MRLFSMLEGTNVFNVMLFSSTYINLTMQMIMPDCIFQPNHITIPVMICTRRRLELHVVHTIIAHLEPLYLQCFGLPFYDDECVWHFTFHDYTIFLVSSSIILIDSRFDSSTAIITIRIIIKIFQPFHSLIEVTLQHTHLPLAIDFKLTFCFLNSLLMRHGTIPF